MEIHGWVLYDDACGFCRRWVPFWGPTLRRRGFEIAPLQSAWVRHAMPQLGAELVDDLRLLLRDGRHLQGADVYRHVMRRIWWAWPFYLLACAPGLIRKNLSRREAERQRSRGNLTVPSASLPLCFSV